MKLKSHYLLLLGTVSLLGFSSGLARVAEAETTEAIFVAQQSVPPSTSPESTDGPMETADTPESTEEPMETADTPKPPPAKPPVAEVPPQRNYSASYGRRNQEPVVEVPPQRNYSTSYERSNQEPVLVAQAPAPVPIPIQPTTKVKTIKLVKLDQVTFSCNADSETPTTIARVKGKDLGIILWVSDLFASKGFDSKTRCQQVTARFEEYNKKNALAYLAIGKLNGQPVICVTSKADGDCGDGIPVHDGLLFTLKPDSNSQATVKQLAAALQNQDEESQLKE